MNDLESFPAEKRYELLVQSIMDYAIYLLDPQGRVVTWNAGAVQIKGFTRDDILGQHFSVFYTVEDRDAGRPEYALKVARESGRFEDETWRVRRDGSRFWASVVLDAIRNEAGELIGFAKITRDITERRAMQKALADSERRFRLLVEGVVDYAIYMVDPQGVITSWNSGARRMKGYTSEEIIGEHFSRFYTPEDRDADLPARMLETARREGRSGAEGWRVRKDGSRFRASTVIDAIHDEAGELIGFAKITRDITDRVEAQKRLDETREQLFQAHKMEALGQLTGGLAHDFNNLLTAVIGGTDLAMRQTDLTRIRGLLESVRSAAMRGSGLTRQLLAFARRQPLEPETVILQEHLPGTAALLRHSLPPGIEVVLDVSDEVRAIEADPAQLELAVLNLGFNARDAMPDGGTLRLGARNASLKGEIEGLAGEYVVIDVSDTGMGIPKEIQNRIFEPFFTTKGFGQGTGLGLSQVFGFAKQSGGTLTVSSEPGEGTTIALYLPAGEPEHRQQGPDTAPAAKILVVDDDPMVAELAAALLEEMGHDPYIVHGAGEALSALNRDYRPDLVFSDVVMPGGISGLELARRIRTRFPELPVLLTSGYSRILEDDPGEFPIVAKPYEYEALSAALDGLLGTHRATAGPGT
ncbi:MAG TPA: PAS domain S-box protein [Alphaproteobacteria bacterium]|nr:PAS domain S-box protein [Alphaproteobacteria bacterium]